MKKLKYLLIVIFMFIPFILVNADSGTCDESKVSIFSVEVLNRSDGVVSPDDVTFENNTINLSAKMSELGSNIRYRITIFNEDTEDYKVTNVTARSDGGYFEYAFTSDVETIAPGEKKDVILTLRYIKEVPDSLLSGGSYNTVSNVNLNINENIVTPSVDNVVNPKTGVASQVLLLLAVMGFFIVLYFIVNKESKGKKTLGIIIALLLILPTTLHAVCECKLKLQLSIEIEKPVVPDTPTTPDTPSTTLETLARSAFNLEDSCIVKYSGQVTDTNNSTVTASNVYFNNCEAKRNVIYKGNCYQIIRTTENGGVKMIYNGASVGGKCLSSRENTLGILVNSSNKVNIKGDYLYASTYTYDTNTRKFTITDTFNSSWGDNTYQNLVGKYTCKNLSTTCGTLYYVNDYYDDYYAYASTLTIGTINKSAIAASVYNSNITSISSLGYMFNNLSKNNIKNKNPNSVSMIYGNDVTYDSANHIYNLSNTASTYYSGSTYRHYTCLNTNTTCETVAYIYHMDTDIAYYVLLENGKTITNVLNEGLNTNVNQTNSSIKSIIDIWATSAVDNSHLEDAVFCNSRSILSLGGWDKNSAFDGSLILNTETNRSLACNRSTDAFNVNNSNARLTRSVGLITVEELNNLNSNSLRSSGSGYWTMTPKLYGDYDIGYAHVDASQIYYVKGDGSIESSQISTVLGVRPVIVLKSASYVESGTGSEDEPFVIQTSE